MGKVTPSPITNHRGRSYPAVVTRHGWTPLIKLAVFHSVQGSLRVKEKELEGRPSSSPNHCGASLPIVVTACWWSSFVKHSVLGTIKHAIWIKEKRLKRIPSCLLQLHLSDSLTNKVSDSQVTANFLGPWNDSFQYVLLKNVKYD